MKKQELQVAALENGTVIDHIPSEKLFTVVSLLGLEQMNNNITIGFNLKSKKLGTKGIIKIADKFFCDDEINRIAVVAPNVKLNIIRDYEVVEKREVKLPGTIARHRKMRQSQVHHQQRTDAYPVSCGGQGELRNQMPLLRERTDKRGHRDNLMKEDWETGKP